MRLFIIGHFHKGKTTLLSLLRGRRADSSFDQRVKRIQNGGSTLNLTQEGSFLSGSLGSSFLYFLEQMPPLNSSCTIGPERMY